ncbi:MAG: VCBS repeat-containing protein [Desulfobacterales bacterium]
MKIRIVFKTLPLFIFMVLLVLMADLKVGFADPIRVAILPFNINSEKELDFLKIGISEILESRISSLENVETIDLEATIRSVHSVKSPVNGNVARETGKQLHADYVIYGSLTVLGKSASIDAKLIDTTGEGRPVSFFRQTESIDAVIPETGNIAKEIGDTILADVQKKADRSLQMKSGKKILEGKGDKKENPSPINAFIPMIWKSEALDIRITGICAGDIDGDGKIEIVVSSAHDLTMYRVSQDRLEKIGEFKGKNYHKYLAVDAWDINQNGKAEIFVSCQNSGSGSLESFAVEWNKGSYSPIVEGENWYFRVLKTEKGSKLFGQRKGISEPFFPTIFELSWNGSSYQAGKKQSLPDEILIFGLSLGNIAQDDENLMAAFNVKDKICVFNSEGAVVWKSVESYGGSESFLEPVSESKEELEARHYLSQRILPVESKRRFPYVITVKNDSTTSRFFKRFRSFSNAGFVCFSWSGLGLSQKAKTDEIAGYVPDFTIADFNNDGSAKLIGAIVTEQGSIISDPQSVLAAFDLSPLLENQENF